MSKPGENKTKEFFFRISRQIYFCGGPNYWSEDLKISSFFTRIHDPLFNLIDFAAFLLIISEWAGLMTQKNLTDKQHGDLLLFGLGHFIVYSNLFSIPRHFNKVRDTIESIAVKSKAYYNDLGVEQQMLKKMKLFIMMYLVVFGSTVVFYAIDGLIQVFFAGGTFTTVVTFWPDVNETGALPDVVRAVSFIIWACLNCRAHSAYALILSMTIGLSHQYKNLCSYFYSLNDIFEDGNLGIEDRESMYEDAFKVGVKLHKETLRDTKHIKEIFHAMNAAQIVLNVGILILLLFQMAASDRTFANTVTIVVTIICVLISTGCLMWSAGDVTVEASNLATAMFFSGWHHCQKQAAVRVRSLLVIAMWQSQVPVEIRCLSVLRLSYSFYVSIVKSSYSVFSVLF